MARGELPGLLTGLDTNLTYDPSVPYGHANAGKDLALTIGTTGQNARQAVMAGDNTKIVGVFLELRKNKQASTLMGDILIMRQSAQDACTPNSKVVGAGNGQIKNEPASGEAGHGNGTGYVLKVLENVANGRVLVRYPA